MFMKGVRLLVLWLGIFMCVFCHQNIITSRAVKGFGHILLENTQINITAIKGFKTGYLTVSKYYIDTLSSIFLPNYSEAKGEL